MLHDRLYLATIAAGADETASRFGLGLEIDEFCTAANFDADFDRWDGVARAHLAHSDRFVFHAPFAELCPCAIDPMVRGVTMRRFRQTAALSRAYGIRRTWYTRASFPTCTIPSGSWSSLPGSSARCWTRSRRSPFAWKTCWTTIPRR